MGNREILLTDTKTDLVSTFSLVSGQRYLLQNRGDFAVRIGDFSDAASATERAAFILRPDQFLSILRPSSGSLFGWCVGGEAVIVIDEAQ